jgi:hypothetical protein
MNYDELETAWRSPRNTAEATTLAAAQARFVADLAQRRRGTRLFLALVFGALTLITVRVIVSAWPLGGSPTIELAHDGASLLFLAVPWVGFGVLIHRMRRHERVHPGLGRSVRQALSALLDEIAMARARLKVVASLHGATLVLLPLVVWQLRKTGKAGDEILWPAFVGWPLFAVGILVALWWYDRSRLRPRQRQLEALHREYEREE